MIYRPQYAFLTPRGFRDETFHYSFDNTNVPVLGAVIAAGQQVLNITLQLQADAEFVLRAWKVESVTGGGSNFQIVIKDPFGNYLSAAPIPLARYLRGNGALVIGRTVVPFESEIACPMGGFFQVDLYNPTTGNLTPPRFTLYGVKRYPWECAA
jgi:hypothetical protein